MIIELILYYILPEGMFLRLNCLGLPWLVIDYALKIFCIALLCYAIFRVVRINRKGFSRKTIEEAAEGKYALDGRKFPVITCDYCGEKIDTARHDVCPVCGSPYDLDKEWKKRHRVNKDEADIFAEEFISEKNSEADRKTKKPMTLVVISAILCLIVFLVPAIYYSSYDVTEEPDYFAEDMEGMEEAPYTLQGDPVILDYNGVKITVKGFYREPVADTFNHLIHFAVENNTEYEINVEVYIGGVNHYGMDEYGYAYVGAGKTKDFTADYFPNLCDNEISNVYISSIIIHNLINQKDVPYVFYESDRPINLKTTSDFQPEYPAVDAACIYEKDGIRISTRKVKDTEEPTYELYMENDTDHVYRVEYAGVKGNGKEIKAYGFYHTYIQKGYVYYDGYFSPDTKKGVKDPLIEVDFLLKDVNDSNQTFHTGYITMK